MVRVGGHRYCVQTNIALTNELDISTDDLNTSQFTNYGRWLLMEQCNHHHEGIARNSGMGLSATLRDFTVQIVISVEVIFLKTYSVTKT